MVLVRNFLEGYRPLNRVHIDVDFAVHNPTLFSSFLVGCEFSFEDNTIGCERIIERAREVYAHFKS